MAKLLFVLSSGYQDGDNEYETGWWGEELFAPLTAVEDAGHETDLASPLGGKPTIDQASLAPEYDPNGTYKALYESGRADDTKKLSDVNPDNYSAVVIVGGHGAMYDLARDEDLHAIINKIYDNGGIVAAECHGPAPLIWTMRPNGKSIIDGKRVTGYPDEIEPEGLPEILPFSLEQELRKIAQYDQGDLNEKAHAVWADPQIVTSRDPFSSELMGEELVKALDNQKSRS
ncbi:type 1 glutamine amidotransferase domain-containing protein [Bacillus thermotolerans]|uniref:type 1 glutamine amidotransferase domain-containing protein n=1 Tax=Bacillus thermotolerans TaxID=1221996 RepID=UPI0005809A31|nr:type 1 glutamine amidotransferase domain-containing protein [Bacillus thermotolerans]KKB38317.1 ThiJ/PfpI family protein [Bacillus thermotolerans]KKB44301.1 ThiJ/PfpI family protein [Bacillus thermotolerans]